MPSCTALRLAEDQRFLRSLFAFRRPLSDARSLFAVLYSPPGKTTGTVVMMSHKVGQIFSPRNSQVLGDASGKSVSVMG